MIETLCDDCAFLDRETREMPSNLCLDDAVDVWAPPGCLGIWYEEELQEVSE